MYKKIENLSLSSPFSICFPGPTLTRHHKQPLHLHRKTNTHSYSSSFSFISTQEVAPFTYCSEP